MLEVFYGIKDIKINKVSKMPSGEQPFIYNGTTFVPLRFVADALGQSVSWDAQNQTVLTFYGYKYNADKKVKDNTNIEYNNYVTIDVNSTDYYGPSKLTFPLNGKYKHFKTKLGLTDECKDLNTKAQVEILVDDKSVFATNFTNSDLPKDVDIDVTNAQKITLKVSNDGSKYKAEVGFFDAHFTK